MEEAGADEVFETDGCVHVDTRARDRGLRCGAGDDELAGVDRAMVRAAHQREIRRRVIAAGLARDDVVDVPFSRSLACRS